MTELYKKYRPKTLKEIIGQDAAVSALNTAITKKAVPHALMLTGPSGVGKTTIARILKDKLDCGDIDYNEINCALNASIDMIREIQTKMNLSPMGGSVRMWYLDEFQSMSRTPFAQQSLLKMLEDTPRHVYFVLATMDPSKVIDAIKTRCTEVRLKSIGDADMKKILKSVLEQEEQEISGKVLDKIIDVANGSARTALNLMEKVIDLQDEKEQLDLVRHSDSERQAIDIARMLFDWRESPRWNNLAALLEQVTEQPETIRHMVLSYASKILLKGGKPAARAYAIICAFETNWYDCGKAGLLRACFECCFNKE